MWQALLKLSLLLVISGCATEFKPDYYDYPVECYEDEIKICDGHTPRNLECKCYTRIVRTTY